MASTEGLLITDPEGSKILGQRVDDVVFLFNVELAPGAENVRLFEEDRARLRAFLTPRLGGGGQDED